MLTGQAIREGVHTGDITIDPFDEGQICANSYGFRLGRELLQYTAPPDGVLDARTDAPVTPTPIPDTGYVLHPGTLYLASTREIMGAARYAATLHACRSVSSLGLRIQLSAPLGHCGAVIPWTLELRAAAAVRVYPDMVIGKIAFWPMQGVPSHYQGRYSGSPGAVRSLLSVGSGLGPGREVIPSAGSAAPNHVETAPQREVQPPR
ncbi:hypothetical protein AB0L82_35925 [Nocardia sp. NPDC052001]|uniref:dCTP deaminase n=1 Tax=Nocardia sp. NPDC052001 TaxID=3154853 RepID=UPI003434FD19